MRFLASAAVIGALVVVAACDKANHDRAATNGNDVTAASPGEATPTQEVAGTLSGQDFANTLAASDAFEIATSRLAANKASTPAVKAFARNMITAHTASTDKLKLETAQLKPPITPDPALSGDQQQKLDGLRALTGPAFEQAYVSDQIAAHETALGVVQAYSESGDVPVLKAIATDAVTMVSNHLKQARQLNSAEKSAG